MAALRTVSGGFGLRVNSMVSLLIPLYGIELGLSVSEIGFLVGTASFVPTFGSVYPGTIVDRLGARAAFVVGAGATASIAIVYVIGENFWVLVFAQLF